jgi:hypothetical protein
VLKVQIEYGHPIRSAITVAGIRGNAASSSRIRRSKASTSDPDRARSYLGGTSLANAAFTVFREQPISRAISEIETPSDLRSRRISAQSSTISTCFLPGSTSARVTGKLVNFQLPHRGQYSVAVDTFPLRSPSGRASFVTHTIQAFSIRPVARMNSQAPPRGSSPSPAGAMGFDDVTASAGVTSCPREARQVPTLAPPRRQVVRGSLSVRKGYDEITTRRPFQTKSRLGEKKIRPNLHWGEQS